ncbi:WD40 repeat domain-containing protein [Streptomyces sp. NPDC005070]
MQERDAHAGAGDAGNDSGCRGRDGEESPDGTLLAAAGDDATVGLWDPVTRRPVGKPLTGHQRTIYALAFSPDGTFLATGSRDGTIRLYEQSQPTRVSLPLARRALACALQAWLIALAEIDGTGGSSPAVFSPDGAVLATGGEGRAVGWWDPITSRPVGESLTGHQGAVHAVTFSPDGTLLATGSGDGTVQLLNSPTRRPVSKPGTGHQDAITSVTFSPDSTLLASRTSPVQLWMTPLLSLVL